MSGYAPNPTSEAENGAASLTAGLLARKGEALPAVDAQAHAGVDISMHPMKSAHSAPPPDVSQETIESLYPASSDQESAAPAAPSFHERTPISAPAPVEAEPQQPPENWTIIPPKPSFPKSGPRFLRRNKQREAEPDSGRKATITFRMPAKDFVRLRFASRDMETTCQSIILDALGTYLDANDVAEVTDETCEKEVERLVRTMGKARRR